MKNFSVSKGIGHSISFSQPLEKMEKYVSCCMDVDENQLRREMKSCSYSKRVCKHVCDLNEKKPLIGISSSLL